MQGLLYLEDEKERKARFYGHGDHRLLEVVMDILYTSVRVLLRPECSGDRSFIFQRGDSR